MANAMLRGVVSSQTTKVRIREAGAGRHPNASDKEVRGGRSKRGDYEHVLLRVLGEI